MKSNKQCLFSAPYSFSPSIKAELNKIIHSDFYEIWNPEDVKFSPDLRYWIVNPGQTFTFDEKIFSQTPNLELIITPSTGTNHIDIDFCKIKKIKVFGLLSMKKKLKQITASSEFTFLMILNSLRRIDLAIEETKNKRWRENEDLMRGSELNKKNVGIIGLGRNGSNIAKWCKSFGANVSYYDPFVKKRLVKEENLENIFLNNDIVVICCALNKETHNLITTNYLKLLRPNSHLINTSRGEVINERDLSNFIDKRKDVSINLDVLSNEVIHEQFKSPLYKHILDGDILVTPHISGATLESQLKAARTSFSILKQYLNGKRKT